MVNIKCMVMGMVGTNCYLVENLDTRELVIVDPALCPKKLLDYIENQGLKLQAILLTHGHFDHIMGVEGLIKHYQVPVYASEKEQSVLENARNNLTAEALGEVYEFHMATYVEDGTRLTLGGMEFQEIDTPGHTLGGCCYYMEKENILFSGDTLFYRSMGRTDFPTGDETQLLSSIRNRLGKLPDETKVYPGHENTTILGDEKRCNPAFTGSMGWL